MDYTRPELTKDEMKAAQKATIYLTHFFSFSVFWFLIFSIPAEVL